MIKKKAYEKYQLWWMITHGHSIDELVTEMNSHWLEDEEREKCSPGTAYADFEEAGFGGSLWACFDEFLMYEYRHKALMRFLLNDAEYEEYLEDTKSGGKERPCT